MQKANGEAAHLSARWIHDRFVLCAGSKNVHLLLRRDSDVEKYRDGRFLVARSVAAASLKVVESMEKKKAQLLLSLLHYSLATVVFEILQPRYQHVVNLSFLEEPRLDFIALTLPPQVEESDSLCALAPNQALDSARMFGISTVDYEIVAPEDAEERMDSIRKGHGYEVHNDII